MTQEALTSEKQIERLTQQVTAQKQQIDQLEEHKAVLNQAYMEQINICMNLRLQLMQLQKAAGQLQQQAKEANAKNVELLKEIADLKNPIS